jgi:hypothetical protein
MLNVMETHTGDGEVSRGVTWSDFQSNALVAVWRLEKGVLRTDLSLLRIYMLKA